ncbi:hypothetical protein AHF37_11058 [Paragonimus kellicotti]|nr:hypothetical protein AHF37_11058 [Paragonimus kellicotti]
MASEAWKSLVRRRSSQRSKQPEKTSVLNVTLQSDRKEDGVKQREQHEDAGKADILMIGETTVSSDQKPNHPVGRRKLRCVVRRGHVQLRLLRSNLRISGASDRSMSSENSRLKDAELAHSSPEFTSPSLRSTRAGAQPVQLKRSPGVRRAYAKQFGVYQSSRSSSISVGRPRGRMRNTWQLYVSRGMGPSVSTLKRWSAAGVNMKRALLTFNECGRVRLSRLNQSRRRRISHSSSGLSVPRLPTISSPASDAAREEYSNGDIGENDDDDDSSVTVAADNSGRPSQSRKKASSVDHFDPNNDECPEFSIITEENRALFASIQADVQAVSVPRCLVVNLEFKVIV